jgi:hypothetical protein
MGNHNRICAHRGAGWDDHLPVHPRFVDVAAGHSTKHGPHPMWWFVSPFLLGGVVTAVVYVTLPRIFAALSGTDSRPSAADTTLAPGDDGSSAAMYKEPRSAIGPMAILLIVVAISTAIPAGLVALLTNNDWGEVSAVAVLGAGLGLLVGIPAALIVWVAARRRRPK